MTDTTSHRATPEQWADIEQWGGTLTACLLELRSRLEAQEAGTTCPHIVTSDEGATCPHIVISDEGTAPPKSASVGSLVERVAIACAKPCNETWDDQARAAILEVAVWLAEQSGTAKAWTFRTVDAGTAAAHWLQEEVT